MCRAGLQLLHHSKMKSSSATTPSKSSAYEDFFLFQRLHWTPFPSLQVAWNRRWNVWTWSVAGVLHGTCLCMEPAGLPAAGLCDKAGAPFENTLDLFVTYGHRCPHKRSRACFGHLGALLRNMQVQQAHFFATCCYSSSPLQLSLARALAPELELEARHHSAAKSQGLSTACHNALQSGYLQQRDLVGNTSSEAL